MHTERDSENHDDHSDEIDFYRLSQDLTTVFVLTLIIGVVFYLILENMLGLLYFAAGGLTYLIIWFGMIVYRAKQHFGGEEE